MTDTFLPADYKEPAGKYLKLTVGEHNIRIMSSAIVGYEFWTNENKPVRSKNAFKSTPNIKKDTGVKFFWAFIIYNYDADAIQICEITQKSIQASIKNLINNKKWGDVSGYDLTITRIGEGFDTEYSTVPNPSTVLPQSVIDRFNEMKINLNALYEGNDPFSDNQPEATVEPKF